VHLTDLSINRLRGGVQRAEDATEASAPLEIQGHRSVIHMFQGDFFGSNFIDDPMSIEPTLDGIRQRIVASAFKSDDELGLPGDTR